MMESAVEDRPRSMTDQRSPSGGGGRDDAGGGGLKFQVVTAPGEGAIVFGGRYRADQLIGKGATTTVYRGVDLHDPRDVAIKVLRLRPGVSREDVQRFVREIETLASLQHPAIVPLLDRGRDGHDLYLVMPFVFGIPLAAMLRGEPLRLSWWLPYFVTICEGLEHAHGRGVVHRDIKPANLVLLDDERQIKVVDFGIALHTAKKRVTQSSIVLGTPTYMAPEQFVEVGALTPASDQYSLGAVLYEVLAGRPPFVDENPAALMYKHNAVAPEPLWRVNPDVPELVGRVVMRTLEKRPDDRFESCLALARALTRAARDA
jgi:eukaryotic-like serine/threonine-protein kinase